MGTSAGTYPRSRLGHWIGTGRSRNDLIHSYEWQAITVQRPDTGITTGSVRCATCGQDLAIRVASEAITQRWRRRWLVSGLLMAVPLVWTVYLLVSSAINLTYDGSPVPFLFALGFGFSAVLMVKLLGRRGKEDGVRSPDAPIVRWARPGAHRIFVPDEQYVSPDTLRYIADHGELPPDPR